MIKTNFSLKTKPMFDDAEPSLIQFYNLTSKLLEDIKIKSNWHLDNHQAIHEKIKHIKAKEYKGLYEAIKNKRYDIINHNLERFGFVKINNLDQSPF